MTSPARSLLLLLLPVVAACGSGESTSTGQQSTSGGQGGASGGADGAGASGAGSGGAGQAGSGGAGQAGSGQGGAGQGGAGAGGAGASGAGAGGEGGAEARATCDPALSESDGGPDSEFCFGPDGKSDMIYRHPFEGGDFQLDCPALVREPAAACPAEAKPCGYEFCGTVGKPWGEPAQKGDRCCYSLTHCTRPNDCGRPLWVGQRQRQARLAQGAAWG